MHVIDLIVINLIVINYYTNVMQCHSHFAWADQMRAYTGSNALQQLTRNSLYNNRACIYLRSEERIQNSLHVHMQRLQVIGTTLL